MFRVHVLAFLMCKTILPHVWGSSEPRQVQHGNSVNVDPWKISEGTFYTDTCPSEGSVQEKRTLQIIALSNTSHRVGVYPCVCGHSAWAHRH